MIKITVGIPTRGVLFAETVQSSLNNPELKSSSFHIIQNRTLPDAHNECIRQALKTDCTHILFVEDDMVIPKGAINKMITMAEQGARYIAVDYGFVKNGQGVECIFEYEGEILWTGLGCTMIDRDIFEKDLAREAPNWLTDEYELTYTDNPKTAIPQKKKRPYGGYDIFLGYQLRLKGIKLHRVEGFRCKHLRMASLDRKLSNEGLYEIEVIT